MTTLEIILLSGVIVLLGSLVVVIQKAKAGMDGLRETLKHAANFREASEKARTEMATKLQEQLVIAEFHRCTAVDYGQMLLGKRLRARERKEVEKYLDRAVPKK